MHCFVAWRRDGTFDSGGLRYRRGPKYSFLFSKVPGINIQEMHKQKQLIDAGNAEFFFQGGMK